MRHVDVFFMDKILRRSKLGANSHFLGLDNICMFGIPSVMVRYSRSDGSPALKRADLILYCPVVAPLQIIMLSSCGYVLGPVSCVVTLHDVDLPK